MPKIVKNNTVYAAVPSSANGIAYNGTTSGISANTVQGAIDELAQGGGGGTAATTTYDNTESGLSADNVQGAIDEVVEEKADRVPKPAEYDSTATYNLGDFVTYQGNVYICIYTITTAEAWNSSHWKLIDADQSYLHSLDPKGAGSFSLNRKANTTIGLCSFAEGYDTTASGGDSHAEGLNTTASGRYSHAEGSGTIASGDSSHAEGHNSVAGDSSHAEGNYATASGRYSHAEGNYTTANHKSQHTFGEYNVLDDSTATASNRGNYVEIVGNGTGTSARSNARTLDWSGNEVLAGGLKINNTQDVAAQVSLTQAQYDALVQSGKVDLVNTIYFITDADAIATSATEVSYSNTTSGLSANTVQSAIDEVASEKADQSTTYTKTEVNSLLEGLKTITTSTITANSTGGWSLSTVCCNKVLNIVSICFEATKSSALDSGWNTMGTLPAGFRPSSDIYVSFIDAQNDFGTHGKINSSGQIQVYKTSSMSTRERGSATYIVSS